MSAGPLLTVEDLTIDITGDQGTVRVVDGIAFRLLRGKTLGLVGESGSGKSLTAQAVMRLLPADAITTGRILFEDADLLRFSDTQMMEVRGDRIGMIFQEPMTSLNPTMRVGEQIAEVLILHRAMSRRSARPRVIDMLRKVGIGSPELRASQYPHELSGGLRQRIMIAMALICGPRLLIADEPTTALDVTIQAQILDLLRSLRDDLDLSILLITHDLGIIGQLCDDVAVIYAGRVVEQGATADVLNHPTHPYTAGLLAATPRRAKRGMPLAAIPGVVPPPGERGEGCSFAQRCSRRQQICTVVVPPLQPVLGNTAAACWNSIV